jgi:hypothetical protein
VFALAACESSPPYDYTLFHEHHAALVLVLPPLDNTMETEAAIRTSRR